jgi:serine/threonine-protein kinase HipA
MERELHVYLDQPGGPVFAGRLFARVKAGRESASFTYDETWLKRRGSFALGPNLMLTRGTFHSTSGLFNAFTDTAPDSWGRKLMRRHERGLAETKSQAPRTLFDIDFLAGVEDETRLGALRFKEPDGDEFLSQSKSPVPPLIELGSLLAATDRIERGRETGKDVMLVLAPGTSLGGARPKATVRDRDGNLLIAKFSKSDDDWPVTVWEAITLDLARKAGIAVPDWSLHKISRRAVLMLTRFDRQNRVTRVPFMSAMTAIDASDHEERRSYLELRPAPALAAHRFQYPCLEYRRPFAQSRLSARAHGMASFSRLRPEPLPYRREAARPRASHRCGGRNRVDRHGAQSGEAFRDRSGRCRSNRPRSRNRDDVLAANCKKSRTQ